MRHDNADNPMFWGSSDRMDWLFGEDARKIRSKEVIEVPALPPMPPPGSSVYSNGGDGHSLDHKQSSRL